MYLLRLQNPTILKHAPTKTQKCFSLLLIIFSCNFCDPIRRCLFERKNVLNEYYLKKSSTKTKALNDTHQCIYSNIMPQIWIYLKQSSKTSLLSHTHAHTQMTVTITTSDHTLQYIWRALTQLEMLENHK